MPSNIYYASIGSEILRFTTSESNTFITLGYQLLKRMKKQGSKHRFIISMLKNIFGKHFNVFADTADNFIKLFSLNWAEPVHKKEKYFIIPSLFLCFLAWWTRCYCYCYVLFLYLAFMYIQFFMLLCVKIFVLIPYFLDPIILYVHEAFLFLIF